MAGLLSFQITPEGGETFTLEVSKMDAILAERALGQPILGRAQEGFFEPVLRLAYLSAGRQTLIPAGTTFEQFVDGYTVALETDDEESSGEA